MVWHDVCGVWCGVCVYGVWRVVWCVLHRRPLGRPGKGLAVARRGAGGGGLAVARRGAGGGGLAGRTNRSPSRRGYAVPSFSRTAVCFPAAPVV